MPFLKKDAIFFDESEKNCTFDKIYLSKGKPLIGFN